MDSALSLAPWQMRMRLARRQAVAAEYQATPDRSAPVLT
jgi:hypothetical protein